MVAKGARIREFKMDYSLAASGSQFTEYCPILDNVTFIMAWHPRWVWLFIEYGLSFAPKELSYKPVLSKSVRVPFLPQFMPST